MDKTMALKLLLACILCLSLITGAVFLFQWLTS
ncbi:hypothetical protein Ga0123462_0330 [Mariprofundus ferrinatatus]|uniref:Uncharacterized protein n=1 Tax=Mariprofundus ferrinatatus TaxID=1921087 RepID=A0A2K8L1L3_9PROT|nr:hypothetical protein Ga0123462_0330 [Mariprofundus ferrinatatus]